MAPLPGHRRRLYRCWEAMMGFRTLSSRFLLRMLCAVALSCSSGVASAQALCGVAVGSCSAGATPTLGGRAQIDGTGKICLWECVSSSNVAQQCTSGTSGTPCSLATTPTPDKMEHVVVGATRDGVPLTDDLRLHSETGARRILHTVRRGTFSGLQPARDEPGGSGGTRRLRLRNGPAACRMGMDATAGLGHDMAASH